MVSPERWPGVSGPPGPMSSAAPPAAGYVMDANEHTRTIWVVPPNVVSYSGR